MQHRGPCRAADAEQGPRSHAVLLDRQGALHDGRRIGRRLPQRQPQPRPHGVSVVTGVLLIVALVAQFRADRYKPGGYWLGRPDQRRRHVDDRQPHRQPRCLARDHHDRVPVRAHGRLRVWYASERTLSIHTIIRHAARASTGSPFSSPSRSVRRPAISWPSA